MDKAEILRDHQAHTLIVFKTGHKWMHALALHQPPVRVVKMELAERRYLSPLEYQGKPYPLRRALRHFKRAARTFGITDGAKDALRELKGAA